MSTNLDPKCIVSNGSTLYAAWFDWIQNTVTIVRSNANPGSVNDLSWSLVSSSTVDPRFTGAKYACHADKEGIFTFLSQSSQTHRGDSTPSQSRGVQYTPSKEPGKTGNWSNIGVSKEYGWSPLPGGNLMADVQQDGRSSLLHFYPASKVGTAITTTTVGIFDTNNLTFMRQPDGWSTSELSVSQIAYAVGNGILYSLLREFQMGNPIVRLTVMTINPSGSPPQDTKTFSTNIGNICEIHKTELITGYYNSKFYVFCTSLDQLSNFLFTFDGSTIGEGIPVNTSIQKVKTFTPVGSANGSTSWALVTNDTSIFGVSLSEPNVGAFTILPGRISYSDPNSGSKGNGGSNNNNSGNNNNGNNNGRNNNDGSSGPNGGKSQSSTQDSEGLPTIAIVFMVIIPAMLAFGIFTWFRRKSRKQGTEVIVADFLPMEPAASHSTLHSSGSQYPLMTLSETSQSYGQTDQGHHVHATHVPYPPLPVATAYPGYPPVPPKQTEDDYYHKVSITGGPQALPQVPGNPQTHVMGSVDLRSPSSVVASPYSSNASTVVGSGFSTPMTVHSRLALESAQLHSVPHSPHGPYAMSPELEDPSRNPQVYVIPVSAPQLYGPGIISGAANVTETGHGVEYRRAPQDRHEVYGSQDYHS